MRTEQTVRAAIYLRISIDDEMDGLAIERQRKQCMGIVAMRGWTLVGEYVDQGISASKRNVRRPEYDRMESDYRAGRFDAIVCYDLDRLTRQPRQLEDWIDAAETGQLALVTASGEADLTTDNGRLFARIKASVARSEIERKGARQKSANAQRFERGLPVPGRRLYGWRNDGVTPIEPEAEIVRRIFAEVVAGESLRGIAARLNAEGVVLTTGNRGAKQGRTWSSRAIRDMVMNRRYAGEVCHTASGGQRKWTPSSAIPLMVDPELAARARDRLSDPKRVVSPGGGRRYLLSGFAMCGVCGAPLKHWSGGTKGKPTYICSNALHLSILDVDLDPVVVQRVAGIIAEDGPVFMQRADENAAGSMQSLTASIRRNDEAALATSRDRDEGLISDAAARVRLLELKRERLDLQTAMEAAKLVQSASGRLIAAATAEWHRDAEPVAESVRVASIVAEHFAELNLAEQREVIAAVAYVSVRPCFERDAAGRKTHRIHGDRVQVVSRLVVEGAEAVDGETVRVA
jgi:DNA invertase Pin-like site-specific DNA recombinase